MLLRGTLLINIILTLHSVYSAEGARSKIETEVYYKWPQVDFNYSGAPATNKIYNPQNILVTSVKVSGNRMFLNIPRIAPGVPSTIGVVPYTKGLYNDRSPLLNPYPSWELQEIGNCAALQSVQASEIDRYDRMWIIDMGRINILDANPDNTCPPKLYLIDLKTDQVIHTYIFPADVISRTKSLVKDVTVDCKSKEACFLYILDQTDPKIIIYDYLRDRSWYVTHHTMVPDPEAANITVAGKTFSIAPFGMSGNGLSPLSQNHDTFYYSLMAGFNIYKVSTKVLKSAPCGSVLQDGDVTKIFTKDSQSDGMTMDAEGRLYYGLNTKNSVVSLNTDGTPEETLIAHSFIDFQWSDIFGFDNDNGYLLVVTSRFQNYQKYDLKEFNIRIMRMDIGTQSYLY